MATDLSIDRRRDALIVVDVQNDFCPGGALAVGDGDGVVPVVNRTMAAFDHIVLTQDWHPPGHASFASSHPGRQPFEQVEMAYGSQTLWPDHCIQGSRGAAFHPELATAAARLVLRKGCDAAIDSYSAFYENDRITATGLAGWLRALGIERVFLAGLATDFCVHDSAMDARREGFQAVLVEDGCRAIDLEGSLQRALQGMAQAGVAFVASQRIAPQAPGA